MVDVDDITNRRVKRIAREHKCTLPEVNAALDNHPMNQDQERFLRRTMALELCELDELQQAFRDKALKDRDVTAGALLVRIAERRQVLLGLAAPAGHAVTVIHSPPPEHRMNSTERISAAIERIAPNASRMAKARSRKASRISRSEARSEALFRASRMA